MYPSGTTTLWLTTGSPGTFTLSLTSIDPVIPVRLGFGTLSGGSCEQDAHVDLSAPGNAQLVRGVDPGTFCVEVSDRGAAGLAGSKFLITADFR